MRTAIIVSVTSDVQSELIPGDEYIIWQTEDSIMFNKSQKQPQISELLNKIEALGKDTEEPSLEEICEMVKDIRYSSTEFIEQNRLAPAQTQEGNEFDPLLKNSIIYEADIVSSIDEIWDAEQ